MSCPSPRQDAAALHSPEWKRCAIRKVVGTYLISARSMTRAAIEQQQSVVASDPVAFDASRVSSKECLAVHVFSGNKFICAPVGILADQPAVVDAERSLQALDRWFTTTDDATVKPATKAGTTFPICVSIIT